MASRAAAPDSCTWSVMRAPAESTSQTTGSSWARAYSVRRTIFSTCGPPRAGLDRRVVGHDANGPAVHAPPSRDHAVAGRSPLVRALASRPSSTSEFGSSSQCERVADEQACPGAPACRPPWPGCPPAPGRWRAPRRARGLPPRRPPRTGTRREPAPVLRSVTAYGHDGHVVDSGLEAKSRALQKRLAERVDILARVTAQHPAMRSSPKSCSPERARPSRRCRATARLRVDSDLPAGVGGAGVEGQQGTVARSGAPPRRASPRVGARPRPPAGCGPPESNTTRTATPASRAGPGRTARR